MTPYVACAHMNATTAQSALQKDLAVITLDREKTETSARCKGADGVHLGGTEKSETKGRQAKAKAAGAVQGSPVQKRRSHD